MIIENHGKDNEPVWIVSLDGTPNPELEESIGCYSKEDAYRLDNKIKVLKQRLEIVERALVIASNDRNECAFSNASFKKRIQWSIRIPQEYKALAETEAETEEDNE